MVRDLIPLLGLREEAVRERAAELFGSRLETMDDGPRRYWTYKEAGLSLLFKVGWLDTIFLEPLPSPGSGYTAFRGSLPEGLAADAFRGDVRSALGAPVKSGEVEPLVCDEGHEPRIISYRRAWDRYEYPAYSLLFEYESPGSLLPGPLYFPPKIPKDEELRLKLIVLIRRPPPRDGRRRGASSATSSASAHTSEDTGVTSCTFVCGSCGQRAETVELVPQGVPHRYAYVSDRGSPGTIVYHDRSEALALPPAAYAAAKEALLAQSAARLYEIQPLWAASYCPDCDASYCSQHWFLEDAPDPNGDSYSMDYITYGTCPQGHTRKVAD